MKKRRVTNADKLITAYAEIATMTRKDCMGGTCANRTTPGMCCSPEYCAFAIEWAKDEWGETLVPTGHERLPLMGPEGCTAAPHLRPMCALHHCGINAFAYWGSVTWTKRYMRLRELLLRLSGQLTRDERKAAHARWATTGAPASVFSPSTSTLAPTGPSGR